MKNPFRTSKKLNKLLCRWFGHKIFVEVYATPTSELFGFGVQRKNLYIVFERHVCERCGHATIKQLTPPLHRSELLRQGWFIEG